MNKEIWREIKWFETKYAVSNFGNVKSIKTGNLLKPYTNGTKYLYVALSCGTISKHFRVHRLVAEAFIPNPQNKKFVNHKDYNTKNNCVENLEWMTMEENINYSRFNVLEGVEKRVMIYGR